MSEEIISQKERFLQEVEQELLRKELDTELLEDGLLHVQMEWDNLSAAVDQTWCCPVLSRMILRDAETDRQLRTSGYRLQRMDKGISSDAGTDTHVKSCRS